jgi:predicted DNA-binding transcriptional regulator AlpA
MNNSPHDLLTAEQLADIVHASPRTIIRWRGEGLGPAYVKAGHRVLYRRADVEAWLESHKIRPVREQGAA